MKIVTGQLVGETNLENIELLGQVVGNAVVSEGESIIRGQITGSLHVYEGARVELFGQVSGDLVVGGEVTLGGSVLGQIITSPGGNCSNYLYPTAPEKLA